jgi:hypothetical protein
MTAPLDRRRSLLRDLYGFDFPDDLFRFWEFATRLRPLEPLNALYEALEIGLVGPFDVLAGRCDRHLPRRSLLLHWRYYNDPPEFFTVLAGGGDGLHWGYYFDDPPGGPYGLASYYARDVFELGIDGDSLFEAVRLHLEFCYEDLLAYAEMEGDTEHFETTRSQLDALREALTRYATADRTEIGLAYTDRYAGEAARNALVTAETLENMGIVVPAVLYRPLTRTGKTYESYLRKTEDPADLVEEARLAIRQGFPGTALKLGKDLWAIGGERHDVYAFELLGAAYHALGREPLARVLRTHWEQRNLPSLDIFEEEADTNGNAD